MNDLSVIDHFLDVFSHYIDSGFGLLHGEVAFLTATLVVIDMTLAGLFWAMGGEDVIGRLIKKTLYVGAFAFIIGNFNYLAGILFNSFAGLGMVASGSTLSQAQFLHPATWPRSASMRRNRSWRRSATLPASPRCSRTSMSSRCCFSPGWW